MQDLELFRNTLKYIAEYDWDNSTFPDDELIQDFQLAAQMALDDEVKPRSFGENYKTQVSMENFNKRSESPCKI